MMAIKLRVLNQFGSPQPLNNPDEIEAHFPYETDGSLVKRFSFGAVKILNDSLGEISVELSPFEVQGLLIGEKQNFSVRIVNGSKIKEAVFQNALNVRTIDVDGQTRKVIERK